MNYEIYAPVLEKAQEALKRKNISKATAAYREIGVSAIQVKVFRFATRVKRRLLRRFQK